MYINVNEKVKHLTSCIFYTDNWETFSTILPSDRHVVGKSHTVTIERDNGNTRRTKVVSKSEEMIHLTSKIWGSCGSHSEHLKY